MYVCIYICLYICIYVCMCICIFHPCSDPQKARRQLRSPSAPREGSQTNPGAIFAAPRFGFAASSHLFLHPFFPSTHPLFSSTHIVCCCFSVPPVGFGDPRGGFWSSPCGFGYHRGKFWRSPWEVLEIPVRVWRSPWGGKRFRMRIAVHF